MLLDKNDVPSHRAVQEAWVKMDDYLEIVMDAMDSLSEWYINAKEYEKGKEVAEEMEEIVQDYSVTNQIALKFQKSRKCSSSVGTCKRNIMNNGKVLEIVSEYDQEIPQSQTTANPMAPRERATQPLRDTRKTN